MPKIDYSARGEILRAARSREGGEPLAGEKKNRTELAIRDDAATKYEISVKRLSGWEAPPHVSLYEPDAYRWIPDFYPGPYYIFFDEPDDSIFEIQKGWQLLVVFQRVKRKGPYHITNATTDFLLTIDQNHIFHGQGTAETWLRGGLERVYNLLGLSTPLPILTAKRFDVSGFGHTVILHGEYTLPTATTPALFRVILEGCDVLDWRSLTHRPPDGVPLDYMYLAELKRARQRINISAQGVFRLYTHCETVRVEQLESSTGERVQDGGNPTT